MTSFVISTGSIKTYPGRVLTAQEFSIMMDRLSVVRSGIINGCVLTYSNGTYVISNGWVSVRGRLVKIEQKTFQIPSSFEGVKWKVYVMVNLGESSEPASIHYCSESDDLVDSEDFNTNNTGRAYCVIGKIDRTDMTSPVITQEFYPEKGAYVDVTLPANGWNQSTKTCTVSNSLATESSYQRIVPAPSITEAQLKALQDANIQDGGQATGSITLKAFGNVPLIDIPVRFIYLGG